MTSAAEKITSLSAVAMAQLIGRGEVSSTEVVEAHIARIEEVDGSLNAVVVPRFDLARSEAKKADEAVSRGAPLGPLHGLPITIKEQFSVEGLPVSMGVTGCSDNIQAADGPLVRRLRDSGAIILGKTNIMQLLVGLESDNPLYGRANNPWNQMRTPGGSSGGEAAIIASGGSPLGLAGDLGGSIRVPAHFCGINGLKPTSHRLPNDDTPGEFFAVGQEAIQAQPGPLARHVEDLILMMKVFERPFDEVLMDPPSPVPWMDASRVNPGDLRIGVMEGNGYIDASPALRRAVREAGNALTSLGAKVTTFSPPDFGAAFGLFLSIMTSDGFRKFDSVLQGDKPNDLLAVVRRSARFSAPFKYIMPSLMRLAGQEKLAFAVSCGGEKSTHAYFELAGEVMAYRHAFAVAMEDQQVDILLMPPYPTVAPPHGGTKDLLAGMSYSGTINALGYPAGVVAATRVMEGEESDRARSRDIVDKAARKIEQDSAGMPVGVQVIGKPWADASVLGVMQKLEDHFRTTETYPRFV